LIIKEAFRNIDCQTFQLCFVMEQGLLLWIHWHSPPPWNDYYGRLLFLIIVLLKNDGHLLSIMMQKSLIFYIVWMYCWKKLNCSLLLIPC
jgi:hypothetical protein